jgi:hypothetical protein
VIDLTALQLLLTGLTGWLGRREREAIVTCLAIFGPVEA